MATPSTASPPDQAPLCQCGCGEPVTRRKNGNGWKSYATTSCKARAFRNRNAEKVYRNRHVPVVEGQAALAAVDTVSKSYGINRRTLQKTIDQLAGRGEVPKVPDQVTNEYLIGETRQKAAQVISSMSDTDILQASFKDKVTGFKGLVEVGQLLSGQPTEIRSYAERATMLKEFDFVLREAARRGLDLTLPPSEYEEAK